MAEEPPKVTTITDLQRQLVLAQVRILELEDIRDDAKTRFTELDALLAELQGKANQTLGDFDHLQGAHRDVLANRDHLQHLLHLGNQALEAARNQTQRLAAELDAATKQESELRAVIARLEQHSADLRDQLRRAEERGRDLDRQLGELHTLAIARLERIAQLDAEIRTMKASRSWRWTKPLRAVERFLRRT